MQILVINRVADTERHAFMQEAADRLGLSFEFIEAVEGAALPKTAHNTYVSMLKEGINPPII